LGTLTLALYGLGWGQTPLTLLVSLPAVICILETRRDGQRSRRDTIAIGCSVFAVVTMIPALWTSGSSLYTFVLFYVGVIPALGGWLFALNYINDRYVSQ
jgi:hypothetical protein